MTPCPPHSPYVVRALKEGSYVVKCLACGLEGPKGKDSLEAKRAFDKAQPQRWPLERIHRSA